MPFTPIQNASQGPANISYVISSPSSTCADSIDHNLPTLLLIHPEWASKEFLHPQFSDPLLRRFNLVALDLRAHGDTIGDITSGYTKDDAAEDVVQFMDALQLPSCFIAGVCMGTMPAIQVAVSHPDRVRGLFLVSPLGTEELPSIADGRQEVHDIWCQSFTSSEIIDKSMLLDATHGALQLGINNESAYSDDSATSSIIRQALDIAIKARGKGNLDKHHVAAVNFLTSRKSYSRESLSKIKSPVCLIHCSQDIAYGRAYVEIFHQQLLNAGVEVTLQSVNAAYFATLNRAHLIDPILHDFIIEHTPDSIPPAPNHVVSPFEEALKKYGLKTEHDDEEDDHIHVHAPSPMNASDPEPSVP